jgi:cell division protein FtsW (lipid II flippase)
MQSRIGRDLADSLVMSVLLFVTLWIAGVIWPSFGAFFGVGHSFLFALAYFVARAVLVLLRDEVYDRANRVSTRHTRRTA